MRCPNLWLKFTAYIRSFFQRLMELRDTPQAVAGGVAIGIFYGFTPLFGLKTLLSLCTAWLMRCSKLAAVLAVCFHDVVTPFWPVILRLEYDVGFWLVSTPHRFPPKLGALSLKLSEIFQWNTFLVIGLPLLVGSMCIALPCAAVCYSVTFLLLKYRNQRHDARKMQSEE